MCDPVCGDGKRVGNEGCDDGNAASNDGCSSTCTIECGYACSGGTNTADTCVSTCGDGIQTMAEACDDGNTDAQDGCGAGCALEDGFVCSNFSCGQSSCYWDQSVRACSSNGTCSDLNDKNFSTSTVELWFTLGIRQWMYGNKGENCVTVCQGYHQGAKAAHGKNRVGQ